MGFPVCQSVTPFSKWENGATGASKASVLQCALGAAMNINTNCHQRPVFFKISLAVKRTSLSSDKEGNRP